MSWQDPTGDWDVQRVPDKGTTPYRQAPARRSPRPVRLLRQGWRCPDTRARGSRTELCVGQHASCSRRGSPTVILARKLSQLPEHLARRRLRRDNRVTPPHTPARPDGGAKLLVSRVLGKLAATRRTGRGASGSASVEYPRPRLRCHVRGKAGQASSGCAAQGFLSPAGRRLGTSC